MGNLNRSKIALSKDLPKPRQSTITDNNTPVHYFLDDPSTPQLAIDTQIQSAPLPIAIQGFNGGGQPVGSLAWQASTCAITISSALKYIIQYSKKPITHWAKTNTLFIIPRAGEDLNAYYNGEGLLFFFIKDPVTNQTVYACDAASAVAHELGHAVLDILRPDFWNTPAFEVSAFHEAFGDCHALIEIMQHEEIIQYALNETGNDMLKSSVISRMAKQMGLVASHLTPPQAGFNPNYLRNAVNDFKYVAPESLASETPDNILSKEPHSFSRIWTGAWWEFLAKLGKRFGNDLNGMKQSRNIACSYLLDAINGVPKTTKLYDALAKQMLLVDQQAGSPYKDILLEVFNNRNILLTQTTLMNPHPKNMPNSRTLSHSAGKSVYVNNSKMIKPSDHPLFNLTKNNPLYNVFVDMPLENVYHYDHNNKMINFHEVSEAEGIESVRHFLDYLHNHQLVSSDPKTPFEIKDNTLVRTHSCNCNCNRNNACDPQAPEYQKGFKANNNAGCGGKGCGKVPICDCAEEHEEKIKLGCFVRSKSGNVTRYKTGSYTSRKVC